MACRLAPGLALSALLALCVWGRRPARPVIMATIAGCRGRYLARVRIPPGGLRRLAFGLHGTRTARGRVEDADLLFPLDGDPLAYAPGLSARGAR